MTDTVTATRVAAGTWVADQSHSEVSFTVRHMMVGKVRGTFTGFDATLTIAQDPAESSVVANIDLSTIDTREAKRDAHLRSDDFFSVDKFPTMTYRSTSVRPDGDDYLVDGELSLHGISKPVALHVEFNGVSGDPYGNTRVGFSAQTEISRKEFGIDIDMPIETGGVVIGDKVKVHLEIEAVRQES